jgi:hypothetical protein
MLLEVFTHIVQIFGRKKGSIGNEGVVSEDVTCSHGIEGLSAEAHT